MFEVIETEDLDAAVELYEKNAVFVVSEDQIVRGQNNIRSVLKSMITANTKGRLNSVSSVQSADGSIAFTRAKGSITRTGSDGKPVTTQFHSIEVVRKQADGTWRIAIDDPRGKGLP